MCYNMANKAHSKSLLADEKFATQNTLLIELT